MLNKLITLKKIIDENPKTPMLWWTKESGLSNDEVSYLRQNGYIEKIGDKKGSRWYWKLSTPDYEMVENIKSSMYIPVENVRVNKVKVTNKTSMLDVIRSYDIEFKLGNGLTLKFVNDTEVSIRRSNGNSINVSDPAKLNELLCFLI